MKLNTWNPLANKPIDWTTSLAEHYERQSRQLEEHHRNLRERDQQMVDAEKGREPIVKSIEAIGSLAKLSTTVSKALEKRQQSKLAKAWKDKSNEEVNAIKSRFLFDKAKLANDDLKWEDWYSKHLLAKDGLNLTKDSQLYKEYMSAAKAGTGTEYLKWQELSARDTVAGMTRASIVAGIEATQGGKEEYGKLDTVGKVRAERQWMISELNRLGYSDGVIATLDLEIHRKNTTSAGTKRNQANVRNITASALALSERLASAAQTDGFDFSNFAHNEIRSNRFLYTDDSATGGLTSQQKSTRAFLNSLRQLGKERRFNSDKFERLLNGEVYDVGDDGKTSVPSGKTFKEVYLGGPLQGMIEHVNEGIEEGENMSYTQLQNLGERDYASLYTQAERGLLKIDTPEWNNALGRLMSLPIKNRDAKLKALRLAANNDQSKEATQSVISRYAQAIEIGALSNMTEDIKLEGNIVGRRLLIKTEKSQKKARELSGLDSFLESIDRDVIAGKKGPFKDGDGTTYSNAVALDLKTNLKKKFFSLLNQFETENPGKPVPYSELLQTALLDNENYKIANGWGKKIGDDGAGKFSTKGTDGDYLNFTLTYKKRLDTATSLYTQLPTKANQELWDKNHINKRKRTKDLRQPGAIFTNEMLAGYFTTGRPSPEMLHIAKKYPHTISRLIGWATEGVLKSKADDDKAFVGNFNLNKLDTKNLPDEKFFKSVENIEKVLNTQPQNINQATDLKNLIKKAKKWGFDSLSQNEVRRFLIYGDTYLLSKVEQEQQFRKFSKEVQEGGGELYQGDLINNPDMA